MNRIRKIIIALATSGIFSSDMTRHVIGFIIFLVMVALMIYIIGKTVSD